MKTRVVVLGSLNMDLVMRLPRMPQVGETMYGEGFSLAEGGKGANQAVASARLGADVAMIGCVGADGFGAQLREALARDGVDMAHLRCCTEQPTGVAMILVEPGGENRIVLAPGANHALTEADIDAAAGAIGQARLLVTQLEVPMPIVVHALKRAARLGTSVVLNPAPAAALPDALMSVFKCVRRVFPPGIAAFLPAMDAYGRRRGCETTVIKL